MGFTWDEAEVKALLMLAASSRLKRANHGAAELGLELVPPACVLHDLGAEERGAQHGRVRHFTAQAAADAVVVDMRHRVHLERVGRILDCERRAAGEADAGVVTGAGVFIDAVAHAHHAFAALQLGGVDRLLAALLLKHALGLQNINDLPIDYTIAWYEQKAVIVLLALLHLGVQNIQLGPTVPAFLSPGVAQLLQEQFGLRAVEAVAA